MCVAKLLAYHLGAGAVARDKVANVLLASKGRGASGGPAHTAQDLARSIARELLGPLLDTACSRLASLLRHTFDIAADSQQLLQGGLHQGLSAWPTLAELPCDHHVHQAPNAIYIRR